MPFEKDLRLASDSRRTFGEYLDSFMSRNGQVRADLFRRGSIVVAHVSFPTGLEPNLVTDPYVSDLWKYANQHGFAEQFKVVLS
jgi:hypothetical protein